MIIKIFPIFFILLFTNFTYADSHYFPFDKWDFNEKQLIDMLSDEKIKKWKIDNVSGIEVNTLIYDIPVLIQYDFENNKLRGVMFNFTLVSATLSELEKLINEIENELRNHLKTPTIIFRTKDKDDTWRFAEFLVDEKNAVFLFSSFIKTTNTGLVFLNFDNINHPANSMVIMELYQENVNSDQWLKK